MDMQDNKIVVLIYSQKWEYMKFIIIYLYSKEASLFVWLNCHVRKPFDE